MTATIEVFVNDGEEGQTVGIVLRSPSIVEHEGELVPGCTLTPWQARCFAHALTECADRIKPHE